MTTIHCQINVFFLFWTIKFFVEIEIELKLNCHSRILDRIRKFSNMTKSQSWATPHFVKERQSSWSSQRIKLETVKMFSSPSPSPPWVTLKFLHAFLLQFCVSFLLSFKFFIALFFCCLYFVNFIFFGVQTK